MEIIFEKNRQELEKRAATFLSDEIRKNSNQPVLFLSSGGSALSLLPLIEESVLSANLTVGILDERFSRDPNINNFSQMKAKPFFNNAQTAGVKFLEDVVQEGDSLEEAGKRFDDMLKKWKAKNPEGYCIATVGVGPDSHVSGVLPYPENPTLFKTLFENKDIWAMGYDAVNKTQYNERITVTLPYLRTLDEAIVFITGENKRGALLKIFPDTGSLYETPARIIRELKSATIFTDIDI